MYVYTDWQSMYTIVCVLLTAQPHMHKEFHAHYYEILIIKGHSCAITIATYATSVCEPCKVVNNCLS